MYKFLFDLAAFLEIISRTRFECYFLQKNGQILIKMPFSKARIKGSICHIIFFLIPFIGKDASFCIILLAFFSQLQKKFWAFKDFFTFSNNIQEGCTAGEDPTTFA